MFVEIDSTSIWRLCPRMVPADFLLAGRSKETHNASKSRNFWFMSGFFNINSSDFMTIVYFINWANMTDFNAFCLKNHLCRAGRDFIKVYR